MLIPSRLLRAASWQRQWPALRTPAAAVPAGGAEPSAPLLPWLGRTAARSARTAAAASPASPGAAAPLWQPPTAHRAGPPGSSAPGWRGCRVSLLAALLAAQLAPGLPPLGRPLLAAEQAPAAERAPRPPDLQILLRRQSINGEEQIGVFGAKADPLLAGLWSVQVWVETADRVTIATDRIRCDAATPLRITGAGGQVLVRQLNPGGPIFPGNRLDHLIWWAVCHPPLAGKDPATLASEARRLGYSGLIQEQQQLLQRR